MPSSKPVLGVNDLQSQFPEIAAEAYGWDPKTVVKGSGRVKDWICSKGHIYSNRVVNRIRGDGCVFCSGSRVLKEFNDLQTKFPDIAAEAYGWDPSLMSSGNGEKKDWICNQGHVYPSRVADRTIKGRGCPFCSGREAIAGINDLQTKFPDIAAEAYGWDPKTVTSASSKKKEWKCSQGHIFPAVVAMRTTQGTQCPYCTGKKVLAGFNDLQCKFADLAAEAFGWDPTTLTAGSNKMRNWKCKKGHIYPCTVSNRTLGRGCPVCAEYGFNPEKDAWFYLMERPGEQQLGITNELDVRIKAHERNGWVLLGHAGPASGQKILDTENAFKKWLKKEIGLIKGTTENWSTVSMEVQSLAELKARSGIETDLF